MSEATAAATTTAATTETAPAAIPTNAPLAPVVESSLADALKQYQSDRGKAEEKPATEAKAEDKPAEKAEEPKTDAKAEEAAKESEKVEEKKDEKPADEVSETMSRLLRQQRMLARQKREMEAAKAAAEAERTAHAKAIEDAKRFEAAKKRNPVEAVEELLGKEVLEGTFPVDLLSHLSAKTDDTPPTAEQIEAKAAERAAAIVQEKLAEAQRLKEEAETKQRAEAEQQRQAQREANRTAFFQGLAAQLQADAAKYPYLVADPVDWSEVDGFVQSEFAKNGAAPSPETILKHFDSRNEEKAKRLVDVYSKRQPAIASKPAKEPPTAAVSKNPVGDSRGRMEVPKNETHRERLERVARELDAQFGR